MKSKNSIKRVAILIYPELRTFEFSCAVELFALDRLNIPKCYHTDLISIESGPTRASGGFFIQNDHEFSSEAKKDFFNNYDYVVIAGWTGNTTMASHQLLSSLRYFHSHGGTLVSFCGGAFALAQTGILDCKTATTHWMYADEFKQQFPYVLFQDNVLFTEEERLYTSAGSAAALDLGLYLIRKDFGASIANQIARRLVISPQREGGQAQYADILKTSNQTDHLSKSIEWANNNLQASISIDEMAKQACLSRRSFDRHFRNTTGMSPKAWLTQQRINLARELLENPNFDMEQISIKSGFGSAMNLRHHFAQQLGITPTHYRKQFIKI